MRVLVNMNSIMAWVGGNARDIAGMKERMRQAYDGEFTDHVGGYDRLGLQDLAVAVSIPFGAGTHRWSLGPRTS